MSLTQKKIKHLAHSFMEENFENLPTEPCIGYQGRCRSTLSREKLEEKVVDFVKKVESEVRYEDMRGPIHITRVG